MRAFSDRDLLPHWPVQDWSDLAEQDYPDYLPGKGVSHKRWENR